MKKIAYIFGSLLILLASCEKETEISNNEIENNEPVAKTENVLTISAKIDQSTKTNFSEEKTFTWIKDDVIGVYVTLGTTTSILEFTAQETGASVEFKHELTDAEKTALGSSTPVFGKHAFYPISGDAKITVGGTDDSPTIQLAGTITQPTTNPMSIIPMVGKNNGSGSYSFTAITGILKVTVTDMPESAQTVSLTANGDAFNAIYTLQEDSNGEFIDMNHWTSGYVDKWIKFTPTNDGDSHDDPVSTGDTRVFYFPIPEGTISSGMKVALRGSSGELMSRTTNTAIVINRNTITPLANYTTWKSLGTGKFYDPYVFNTELGYTAEYVDVEIQQSRIDANRFRLVNPYGAAWSHYNYSWTESWSPDGPSPYFSFYTLSANDSYPYSSKTAVSSGEVYFYPHFTGALSTSQSGSNGELRLTHSNFHNNTYVNQSIVYEYQTNGLPSNIRLYPRYTFRKNGGQTSDSFVENGEYRIIFPGCSAVGYGEPPVATVSGDYNNRKATIVYNDAATIKYAIVSSSSASLPSGASQTSDTEIILTPQATGTYYLVYQGFASDGTTSVGPEKRVQFLYVSNNVSDIVGAYSVKGDSRWQITLTADGDNVKITAYKSSNSSYDGASGNISGTFSPANGTITFISGGTLTKDSNTYYVVGSHGDGTNNNSIAPNTWYNYENQFVLTFKPVDNNANLRLECNMGFCVATNFNETGHEGQFKSGGQHWGENNGVIYFTK